MTKSVEIEGTVETVLPLQEFESGFSKRVLVVNTGGEYPQTIPVEFTKAKADLLTGLRKGQPVVAHCNVNGREYNGKYYSGFNGWKLDKGEAVSPEPQPSRRPEPEPEPEEDDDIPF